MYMLSISYWADKVSTKISASEKFIGGQTHTLGICDDLIGGQNRIHRPYASLTPAEVFLTPAELSPAKISLYASFMTDALSLGPRGRKANLQVSAQFYITRHELITLYIGT